MAKIKVLGGSRTSREWLWNFNNATSLLYVTATHRLFLIDQQGRKTYLRTLTRENLPAFIEEYISNL